MKNEDKIIGEAVLYLLKNRPREEFGREMLIGYLTRLYVQKYETSDNIEEIETYLSALKIVKFNQL